MVMAIVYTRCGQYDKAIGELEVLLSQQTNYSVNDFKLNSEFEPLRNLPRYQQLLKRYAL
jgi:hypothetical protein